MRGDRDTLTRYDLARQAYAEMHSPKAFMTRTGQGRRGIAREADLD